MSLEGDFDKLGALIEKLGGAKDLAPMAAQSLKSVATDEYHRDFAEQRGPLGDAWSASPHSMYLSGDLSQPTVSVSGTNLEVQAGAYYARFHQAGWSVGGVREKFAFSTNIKTRKTVYKTARIGGTQAGPARPVLPTSGSAGVWEAPLQKTIEKVVEKFFA